MTEKTEQALKKFAGISTFDSKHPCDMDRFYKFIAVAYFEDDKNIPFDDFKGAIEEISGVKADEEFIRSLHHTYSCCIEFADATGFNGLKKFEWSE